MTDKMKLDECYLGIELGSTRIKACLTDESFQPIASGGFEWENKHENGYWTYSLTDIHNGVKGCYASLKKEVFSKFGINLSTVGAIGISGMMHGYLAFDESDHLLVPFRTWRNTTTAEAAEELTSLFGFNIPQRWSIAHLYQAMKNNEPHVSQIAHITTVAGYIHYLLTGKWEVGIGEASGIFPVNGNEYDKSMLDQFDALIKDRNFKWSIYDILPKVKKAGSTGAYLTEAGAQFLDDSGSLKSGIPVCPPEGDAGTGMVATNSVLPKTGNISAGTSVFSMLVLEKPICGVYPEIDIVSTPDGLPVAMIHCNNGCSELDGWVGMFEEFSELIGVKIDKSKLYETLYQNSLTAKPDCGGIVSYNFLASEPVAGISKGKPMYFRTIDSKMTLANFFRSQLYSAVITLKIGMDLLVEKENAVAENFNAHGGLFKVKGVAQKYAANILNTPISISKTAGEGGAWGMALLAAYMQKGEGLSLGKWLRENVFCKIHTETIQPEESEVNGALKYFEKYEEGLSAQKVWG